MSHENNPLVSEYASTYDMYHDANGVYNYTPNVPTLDADELLGRKIARTCTADSLVLRRFSQTPLAPDLLTDLSTPYAEAAYRTLERRVGEAAAQVGLEGKFIDAVELEVTLEHERRMRGNSEAARRLYREVYGTTLSENDAELIWNARTGDATLAGAAELLLRYPVIGSIEGAKYTQPFDQNIQSNMESHVRAGLGEIARKISHPSRLSFHVYKQNDPRRDVHYIDVVKPEYNETNKTLLSCIMAVKDAKAEVSNGETTVQLIRKQTMIMLPLDLELTHDYMNPNNINNHLVNLQPVSVSCYWRVIENSTAPVE